MRSPYVIAIVGTVAAIALYTIYWFAMADQIEEELQAWVEDQAAEGTEVTFDDMAVTGFPFSLVATLTKPNIYVGEGERQPHWKGERLKAKTRPYSYRHVDIEFEGRQSITFLDDIERALGSPERVMMHFDGSSMTMGLVLTVKGKIERALVDLRDLRISTANEKGQGATLEILPNSIMVERVRLSSAVREAPDGSAGKIAHDLALHIDNLATDRNPPNGLSNEVKSLEIDITRTSDEMVGFHNGSLRIDRQQALSDAKDVTIRTAHIEWAPIMVDLSGQMRAPPKRDFSGNIFLKVKGHRDLVRVLTEEGDIAPVAAVLSGALLGALEMLGTANEDGTIEIPLKIDDGDVKFLFLHLTDLDEIRRAAGQH